MAHYQDATAGFRNSSLPGGLKTLPQDGIEVKVWEIYLSRSRTNFSSVLSAYSLGNGPKLANIDDPERLSFRFTRYDWDKSIHQLLVSSNVPFQVIGYFRADVSQKAPKKKVYVVEDDLNTLFALNTMLEDAGYDVLMSHSGIRLLEKSLPATDLFILDKRMPDIDGIDVCLHLRSQAATCDIPIVMISATRDFTVKALKAGVNDCLEKPFQMHQLLGLVSKHTSAAVTKSC